MTWFAFQGLNGGKAIDLAGVQEKQAVVEGFHGYATESEAESKPNSVNPLTQGMADLFIADYKAAVAEQAQPGGKNASNPLAAGIAGDKAAAGAVLGNITGGITGFSGTNFVLRAAKVIIGATLIIVGLAHMTGADNAIAVTARKIPLPM